MDSVRFYLKHIYNQNTLNYPIGKLFVYDHIVKTP